MQVEFGISKCAILIMKPAEMRIQSERIVLPGDKMIRSLNSEDNESILGA